MARFQALVAATGFATLAFVASTAHAQTAPTGFTLQQFDPAPAGDAFFQVPDARSRGLLELHEALVANFAHRPLRYLRAPTEYVTSQMTGNLDVSAVAADALLLNLDLPYTLSQSGEGGFDRDPEGGLGDLRVALRVTGYASNDHLLHAAVQMELWVPTGDEDALTGDGKLRFNPKLIVSGGSKQFVYAANMGFLFREHHDLGNAEIGKAVTFGAGFAGLLFDRSLQIGPEIYGNMVVQEDGSDTPFLGRSSTPVEAMMGAKLRIGAFVLGASAGRAITRAPGAAEARGVLSLTHTFDARVFDRDADGLRDERDRCPDDPGFRQDGCPESDQDGDTIIDESDACPAEAGLVHADADKNGCPPEQGPLPAPTRP